MKRSHHVIATIGAAATTIPLGFAEYRFWLIGAGMTLNLILHPDLDQGQTPYGLIRKHRGLSHVPVIGTLDRILWFLGPLILVLWMTERGSSSIDPQSWFYVVLGLMLTDGLHFLLDILERRVKKWSRVF